MVEFATREERTQALDLDRRRKNRRRRPTNGEEPLEFKIKIYLERCTSERFVRRFFNSSSVHTEEHVAKRKESGHSSSKRSSSLAKRCIMLRRFPNSEDEKGMVNENIPEAPAYHGRKEDNNQKTINSKIRTQPMEIHRGSVHEKILRSARVSHQYSIMVVELESEDSVDNIMTIGAGAQDEDTLENITNLEASESSSAFPTAILSVPVELHPVRSENHAKSCLKGIDIIAHDAYLDKSNGNIQQRSELFAKGGTFLGDDDSSRKPLPKPTNLEGSSQEKIAEDQYQKVDMVDTPEIENLIKDQKTTAPKDDSSEDKLRIQDLEREIHELRSERDRLMTQAELDRKELLQNTEEERVQAVMNHMEQTRLVKDILQQLQYKHRDLQNEKDGLQKLVEKSSADIRRITEERDSIRTEYEQSMSIWESRFRQEMDEKRKNLSKGNEEYAEVCVECDIVRFYTGLASQLIKEEETSQTNVEH
eukprot:jgi/Psemu1/30461/gm1.30461_g